jgi:hypothetical protein
LERVDQPIIDQGTEHRASVIAHHEDGRLFPEVITESKRSVILIAKNEIGRDLHAGVLLESHATQIVRC